LIEFRLLLAPKTSTFFIEFDFIELKTRGHQKSCTIYIYSLAKIAVVWRKKD